MADQSSGGNGKVLVSSWLMPILGETVASDVMPSRPGTDRAVTLPDRRAVMKGAGLLAAMVAAEPLLAPPGARAATLPRHSQLPADQAFRWLDGFIREGMKRYQVPGAAVAVHYRGRDFVRGYGVTSTRHPTPVDERTLFRIGSTSKTFTGTALMRLADAGRVELDQPVRAYLPSFVPPAGAMNVTVRQLVNHSAGWLGEDYQDEGRGSDALARYVSRMYRLPQLTPPGQVFAYNNAALTLAGRIVEQVSGKIYEYAIGDLLLGPLGLKHSFFFSDQIIGYNVAVPHAVVNGKVVPTPSAWYLQRSLNPAGGMISSVSDQLAWAKFHLGDGRAPDGTRLLSASSLRAMRSDPGPGGTLAVELLGMGVAWMIRPTAQGVHVIQHGGDWTGEHSGFWFVPEQDFAMTMLTNSETGHELLSELFVKDTALRRFTGLTNLPAVERSLTPAQLAPYAGTYVAQAVPASGQLVTGTSVIRPSHGGLAFYEGAGSGTPSAFLTFYDSQFGPDYVLRKDAAGNPTGSRANFLRDGTGRVAWLRLGGRLYRHRG